MREYFQQLQQYALKSESNVISNLVYDFMVISILATKGGKDHTLKSDQILKNIETYFPIHNTSFQIINALARLVNTDQLTLESNLYTLTKKAFDEYNSDNDVQEQLEKSVKKLLEEKIKADLGNVAEKYLDTIVCNFFNLLDKTFNAYGAHAVRLFSNDDFDLNDLRQYSGFGKLFHEEILKLIPPAQHDQVKNSFNEFFFKPTKPLCTYLHSRSVGYLIPRVINADPEFKKLSKESLKNKQIILDTNFVINLLLNPSRLHTSLSVLISETQRIGIKVSILSITKDEFLRRLDTSRQNFELHKKGKKYSVNIEDPFVDAYYANSNAKYTFNDFVARFEHVDSLLQSEYGIDMIKPEEYDEEIPEGLTEDIASVSTSFPPKTKSAQIHDAVCIEYVRKKRQETEIDETGFSSWFLTLDTTLRRAERKFYDHDIVSNITPAGWLHAITPFLGGTLSSDTTKEAFSKLISVNFVVRNVKTKIFTNLLATLPSLEGLPDEIVKKMIGDQYIHELFVKLSTAQGNEDSKEEDEQWKKIRQYIEKTYVGIIKEQNQKLENQDEKLEMQDERLEKQEKKIGNLTKESKQNKNQIDSLKNEKITASSITRFLKWLLIGIVASVIVVIVVDYFTTKAYTVEAILACVGVSCAFYIPWFHKIKKLV